MLFNTHDSHIQLLVVTVMLRQELFTQVIIYYHSVMTTINTNGQNQARLNLDQAELFVLIKKMLSVVSFHLRLFDAKLRYLS